MRLPLSCIRERFFARSAFASLVGSSLLFLSGAPLLAQQPADDDDVFELSPFIVDATRDRGFQATNTVSGTSLNIAIRDLPMSLEAITSQFIEDTGATTFSEALRFSSGVFTEQFLQGSPGGADGGNSRGANQAFSADRSPSSRAGVGGRFSNAIMIRGFNVPFQNLDGFRYGGSIAAYGIILGGVLDTVNVERLEVVRGPNSLLYGVGVLSGIVNIIPRRPLSEPRQRVTIGAGDYGFRRATLDVTGPLKRDFLGGTLEYRTAAAFEKRGSWTDFQTKDQEYYVGQLQFRHPKWMVIAEAQYSDTKFQGIGTSHLYDNLNGALNQDFRNEFGEQISWTLDTNYLDAAPLEAQFGNRTSWPDDVGGRPQSFRLTGPDTYHWRRELNLRGNVDFMPTRNLTFSAGALYTWAKEENFNVNISTITREERELNITNLLSARDNVLTDESRRQDIQNFLETYVTVFPLPADAPPGLGAGATFPQDFKLVRYWWRLRPEETRTEQFRVRGVYTFETPFLFDSTANHTILVGRHDIKDTADVVRLNERINNQFARDGEFDFAVNPLRFRRIDDMTPIRYEGEPLAQPGREFLRIEQWFTGHFGLYQGRFFDNRATVITGFRHDRYISFEQRYLRINEIEGGLQQDTTNIGIGLIQNPNNRTDGFIDRFALWGPTGEKAETEVTGMLALGYEINRAVSIYGLVAQGVTPNTGLRDGSYRGIDSERSVSYEVGLKVDLFGDRISGTISAYRIQRRNAVWEWRNAPSPARWVGSGTPQEQDPSGSFNPADYVGNGGTHPISYGVDSFYFPFRVGAVRQINPITGRPQLLLPPAVVGIEGVGSQTAFPRNIIFLDYSRLDEEAISADGVLQGKPWRHYLEQAFADVGRGPADTPAQASEESFRPIYYQRTPSGLGLNPSIGNSTGANVTYTDEAEGMDFQLFIRPTSNWQIVLNYAYTTRQATTPFELASVGMFGTEYDVWVRTFGREAFGLQEWDTTGDGVPNYITRAGAVGENPTEAELQAAQVRMGDVDPADMIGGLQGTSLFFGSKHDFSFWNRYEFTMPALEGVVLGFGGNYRGPAPTAIPIGGTDLAENQFQTPPTAGRWSYSAMLQYNFTIGRSNWSARLNVNNLFNHRYSQTIASYDNNGVEVLRRTETWSAPRSFRLTFSGLF